MKQIKVFSGLTHHHVELEVNKWLEDNQHAQVEQLMQSEWTNKEGHSFTISLFYDDMNNSRSSDPSDQ